MPLDGVDHVLALGLRYFSWLSPLCAEALRKRVPGKVAQIADHPRSDRPVWTLHVCGPGAGSLNHHIGWAADPEICAPEQDDKILNILIDHPHYEGLDFSAHVANHVRGLIKSDLWRDRWQGVEARRSIVGGVEPLGVSLPKKFTRKHVPYVRSAKEYNKSHIFLPTHKESVGLVVLEAAMAGALVVARDDFIPHERLNTVRHIRYSGPIDWKRVLSTIDPQQSRAHVIDQTWAKMAERICKFFMG
jgi:hypothetical protein